MFADTAEAKDVFIISTRTRFFEKVVVESCNSTQKRGFNQLIGANYTNQFQVPPQDHHKIFTKVRQTQAFQH